MRKVITAFVTLCFFSPSVFAETLIIEYKDFYNHFRKLDNENLPLLQFSFGLQHTESSKLCAIDRAYISTPKQTIAVDVNRDYRFNLPRDRVLRIADANVVLEIKGAAHKCDMSVQLETLESELKTSYQYNNLIDIYEQYREFFEDMGGFLSFMMPSVTGLVFHFDHHLNKELANGLRIRGGRLQINETQLFDLKSLELPEKPLRITALTQSS